MKAVSRCSSAIGACFKANWSRVLSRQYMTDILPTIVWKSESAYKQAEGSGRATWTDQTFIKSKSPARRLQSPALLGDVAQCWTRWPNKRNMWTFASHLRYFLSLVLQFRLLLCNFSFYLKIDCLCLRFLPWNETLFGRHTVVWTLTRQSGKQD